MDYPAQLSKLIAGPIILEITMTDTAIPFRPDWVSPPGDTIADLMEERGWPQAELAVRLGYTTKHVSQLINGKAAVTEDTALRLERVLGGGAAFWLAREAQFRAQRARLAAAGRFSEWTGWLNKLPVKELMQEGAIPKKRMDAKGKPDLVEALLRFFGVASPDDWERHYARMEVSFRRTRKEQSDIGAISAWLRLGEIETEGVVSPKYDRVRFEAALKEIRTLTLRPPEEFEPRLRELCRESGVALVLLHGKKTSSSTTMTTTSLSPRKSVKPMPGPQISLFPLNGPETLCSSKARLQLENMRSASASIQVSS